MWENVMNACRTSMLATSATQKTQGGQMAQKTKMSATAEDTIT